MAKINTIYTYQLNNVQTEFNIPFDYLTRKFVKVTLIGKDRKELRVGIEYRFLNNKTIKTSKPWGSNDGYQYIEIRRETSATDTLVDFSDGSILRAGDLTIANLQAMHIAEEARSLAADSISVNDEGNLDARARRIVNVANPVGRLDAVNKAYVDDAAEGVIDSRNKALQYRNEAERFRNEAEAFKNTAETKAVEVNRVLQESNTINAQAISSSAKAQQYATSAQQSASTASQAEKNAQASDKSAANSAEEAKRYAASVNPELLVHKAALMQTTGSSPTEVMSQKAVTLSVGSRLTVDNIASLQALSLEEGTVVNVLGYHIKNDGSEHLRIVSNSDDGSGVLLSNGKYATCKLAVDTVGYLDLRWLGAKGDYSFSTNTGTDCSQIMIKAIDYVNKRCSTAIMIIGNFFLERPITTRGQLYLKGLSKPSAQLIKNTTDYVSIVKPASSIHLKSGITAFTLLGTGGKLPTEAKDTHFYVEDLYIASNGALSTTCFIECKTFGAPSRPCHFKGVEATKFGVIVKFTFDDGMHIGGTNTYNFTIDNSCKFYSNTKAVVSRGKQGTAPSVGGFVFANSVIEQYSSLDMQQVFGANTITGNLMEGGLDSLHIRGQLWSSSLNVQSNYFEANTGTWSLRNLRLNMQDNYYHNCSFKAMISDCIIENFDIPTANVGTVNRNVIKTQGIFEFMRLPLSSLISGTYKWLCFNPNNNKEFAVLETGASANFDLPNQVGTNGFPLTTFKKDRLSVLYPTKNYLSISAAKGDIIVIVFYKTKGWVNMSFVRDGGGVDSGFGANDVLEGEGTYIIAFENKTVSPITRCTLMGWQSRNKEVDIKISSASVYVVKPSELKDKLIGDYLKFPLVSPVPKTLNAPYASHQTYKTNLLDVYPVKSY